jgi:hypothetical protein
MKLKLIIVILITVFLNGCTIGGFDLSACGGHLGVCTELFWDNRNQIIK